MAKIELLDKVRIDKYYESGIVIAKFNSNFPFTNEFLIVFDDYNPIYMQSDLTPNSMASFHISETVPDLEPYYFRPYSWRIDPHIILIEKSHIDSCEVRGGNVPRGQPLCFVCEKGL